MSKIKIVGIVFVALLVIVMTGALWVSQRSSTLSQEPVQNTGQKYVRPTRLPATTTGGYIISTSAVTSVNELHAKGFSALVSVSDTGFEPRTITVNKGATIRFFNNSGASVHIAASGDALYPGKSTCGASAFDSCKALTKNDFWEFTFAVSGTWTYQDTATGHQGTVRVN